MEFGKCVVIREKLTEEDIIRIRNDQKNTSTQNCRIGEESAFSKALKGSKLYLKAQGFISDSEE